MNRRGPSDPVSLLAGFRVARETIESMAANWSDYATPTDHPAVALMRAAKVLLDAEEEYRSTFLT